MQSLYESALTLKNGGNFDAARRLFETLLREYTNPEDQAYILLHLFACYNHLRRPEEAHDALNRGYALAPEVSRFHLDAGIEEAVWHSEKGEYSAAILKYLDVLDKFGNLLSEPEERSRLAFVKAQLEVLSAASEEPPRN